MTSVLALVNRRTTALGAKTSSHAFNCPAPSV